LTTATTPITRVRYSTFKESILISSTASVVMPNSSLSPRLVQSKKFVSPSHKIPFGSGPVEFIVSSKEAFNFVPKYPANCVYAQFSHPSYVVLTQISHDT